MRKYKATYQQEIIREAKQLQSNNCGCVLFKNIGETTAIIDGIIKIEQGETFSYNEKPYVQIESDFSITFENETDKQLLVVKTFYKEV